MQIAKILKEDKVLTAKAHYAKKKGKALPETLYDWRDSTIVSILARMDYCGHTVNFKSYSKSHKLKKRIYEDGISGAISHDWFLKLSAEYEAEQRELEEKVKADQQEADTYEQNRSDFDSFAAIIRKYVGITELSATQPKRQGA